MRDLTPECRHNRDTHRVVTVCPCGLTVTFSDSGLTELWCPCGRLWRCDGQFVSLFERRRSA